MTTCKVCLGGKKSTRLTTKYVGAEYATMYEHLMDCSRCNGTGEEPFIQITETAFQGRPTVYLYPTGGITFDEIMIRRKRRKRNYTYFLIFVLFVVLVCLLIR